MRAATLGSVAAVAIDLAAPSALAQEISRDRLIRAAKATTPSQIDYSLKDCGDTRSVKQWLGEVLADTARSVDWRGGRCVLAIPERPRDAGTKWCAHAVVTPRTGKDRAIVEIYFDRPVCGRAGKAFAFRALTPTKDGPDHMRETWAFEDLWKGAHVPGYSASGFQGCR